MLAWEIGPAMMLDDGKCVWLWPRRCVELAAGVIDLEVSPGESFCIFNGAGVSRLY